eukprot:gene46592-58094_t
MNCNSVMVIYDDGSTAWTTGNPTGLTNALKGRQKSLPSPVFVSTGSNDEYFIRFAD